MSSSASGAARGAGALSGLLGVSVITVSAVLLAQAIGYRTELSYLFGNGQFNGGVNPLFPRSSYNIFGYEFDPLIGMSAGGIVVGLLQLISCFFLCCGKRGLTIGWIVFQIIVLIGTIVCFALGIYFEVYSYRNVPGYGFLFGLGGAGAGGLGINPLLIQQQIQLQNSGLLNPNLGGLGGNGGFGNTKVLGDYLCNHAGQAYCGVLGISIVGIIGAMILAGISARNQGYEPYESDSRVRLSSSPDRRYKV